MVKRRELTENEGVCIRALHDTGWSLRQIGTGGLINLLSTVYIYIYIYIYFFFFNKKIINK